MSISGIQGQLLEVIIVGCNKLKDTEWISRQDPYVIIEYGSNKFRTRTCTDGGRHPIFQEKFVFTLVEGLREMSLAVWNSNTLTYDDFIGSGKVQLHKVIADGFDDSCWPLQTKTGRHAGEVRIIMHYANANKPASSYAPSAPPYSVAPPLQQPPQYSTYPPVSTASYPHPTTAYPPPPPSHYASYPPNSTYPPPSYPPHPLSPYPPPPYAQQAAYPPNPYPPPPQHQHHPYYNHPSGPYSGIYPPPPY